MKFKIPATTSRDTLTHKDSWFIILEDKGRIGIGEAGIIPGLSIDQPDHIENALDHCCQNISDYTPDQYEDFPSIQFAVETALKALRSEDPFIHYVNDFSSGNTSIEINGLVWMGDRDYMKRQIKKKVESGFKCIKLKVGALDFESELTLLQFVRKEFSSQDIQLRLDANGAFSNLNALSKLNHLSAFDIHSIEQPIKAGQFEDMAKLCKSSPIPIALDEELIGVSEEKIRSVLMDIAPQYIILKPSLLGGCSKADIWIREAETLHIGWWATSALESNIGLNAIAQWISNKNTVLPQGLGTGQLYENNFDSPLLLEKNQLSYSQENQWDIHQLHAWESLS